jgi:hypothetical protein
MTFTQLLFVLEGVKKQLHATEEKLSRMEAKSGRYSLITFDRLSNEVAHLVDLKEQLDAALDQHAQNLRGVR